VGCGRRATEADCERIVERVAELDLREAKLSVAAIQEQIQAAKASLKERTMKDCVGGRITDEELDCMAHAKTAKQVVEECFD
jgi:hypothetical protein